MVLLAAPNVRAKVIINTRWLAAEDQAAHVGTAMLQLRDQVLSEHPEASRWRAAISLNAVRYLGEELPQLVKFAQDEGFLLNVERGPEDFDDASAVVLVAAFTP